MIAVTALSSCSNTESIEEISPYSAQGTSHVTTITNVEETAFIDSSTTLPDSLPVYVNNYAYNQEGPMFQINDEVTSEMTSNLTQFLNTLYDEAAESTWEINTHPDAAHQVYYENDDLKIWSAMSGLSILTHAFDLSQQSIHGDFQNNPIIEAAVDYLNISSPQMTSNIEYSSDGTPFEYRYKKLLTSLKMTLKKSSQEASPTLAFLISPKPMTFSFRFAK